MAVAFALGATFFFADAFPVFAADPDRAARRPPEASVAETPLAEDATGLVAATAAPAGPVVGAAPGALGFGTAFVVVVFRFSVSGKNRPTATGVIVPSGKASDS